MLKLDDFKTFESYKKAIKQDASRLTSGPRTKFWVYRNVDLVDSAGRKQTVAIFYVFGDDRPAQSVLKGKTALCKGMCGVDSGRIVLVADRGKTPYDLLKTSVAALLGKPLLIPPNDGDEPPDHSFVDVDKLKKMVIEAWAKSRPVKVVAAARGPLSSVAGYVTQEKFLTGCDCNEMSRRLGLPSSLLKDGAYVMRLKRLPNTREFELRGYTNTPAGKTYQPGGKSDYPPGSGVPQWKLTSAVPADPVRGPDGKPRVFRPGDRFTA